MENTTLPTVDAARALLSPALSKLQRAIPGASKHSITVTVYGDGQTYFSTYVQVGYEHVSSFSLPTVEEAIEHMVKDRAKTLRESAEQQLRQAEVLEGGML